MTDFEIRVLEPPAPFVTPDDIKGDTDPTLKTRLIAAVSRSIAAPAGWLNRSLGRQTLELRSNRWPWKLPFRPIISIESIVYDDVDGIERTVDPAIYKLVGDIVVLRLDCVWPATSERDGSVRTTYVAGYEDVPEEAAFAVILGCQNVIDGMAEKGGLRSFEVQGAFSHSFNSPEIMLRTRTKAMESLLAGLRIY